jgi:hypothetical protein
MDYSYPTEEELNLKYKFGDDLKYPIALNRTPIFAYDYIDIGKTEYHFHQKYFTNYDAKKYFSKLKEISSMIVDDFLNDENKHFHIYQNEKLSPKLKSLFKALFNKTTLKVEEYPPFGQIALYTDKNGANKEKGLKSPRIYFIIGKYAVFHILFYDPYHEINPGK